QVRRLSLRATALSSKDRGDCAARQSDRGPYSVIDDQRYYRANHGDEDAVDVNAGNAGRTHHGENPSADERSDDSQNDVANQPFAGLVYDLAADEARDWS